MSDEHPVRKAFAEQRKEQAQVAADLGALSYADVVEARSLVREELHAVEVERERLERIIYRLGNNVWELTGEIERRIAANEDI